MKIVFGIFTVTCGVLVSSICLGQLKATAVIGNQEWLKRNLDVASFRNGDPIPEVKTDEEWKRAGENKQPAWCYYNNDPTNGPIYGKLYNWYAVNDPRGLAPIGWHIPSDEEWTALIEHLDGDLTAGLSMKSISGWNENGNGNNKSGFAGQPGGDRSPDGGFGYLGRGGSWWSTSESAADLAWGRELLNIVNKVFREKEGLEKSIGFSVRCIKGNKVVDEIKIVQNEIPETKSINSTPSQTKSKALPAIDEKKEGKISGYVWYYVGDYDSKIDVGARVLILNSLHVPDFKMATVDSFNYIKEFRSYYHVISKNGNSTTLENLINILKEYGVETQEKFTALDNRNFTELSKIKYNTYYGKEVIIDATGKYTVSVPAGKYYVYTISKNSRSTSMTEVLGKVSCIEIVVKENETTTANAEMKFY